MMESKTTRYSINSVRRVLYAASAWLNVILQLTSMTALRILTSQFHSSVKHLRIRLCLLYDTG